MVDFRNFWNDTHHKDDWMKGAEGDFEVLPFSACGVYGQLHQRIRNINVEKGFG